MYELTDINPKLIISFYKAMDKTYQKENWYSIILVAVKKAVQTLLPQVPLPFIEPYLKEKLQPFIQYKQLNIITRDFIDDNEAIEVYNYTFNEETLNRFNEDELEMSDCIYDLLQYDQVTIINGEKYLSSVLQLTYWMDQYMNAYNSLIDLYKKKPDERNYTTSTNSLKAPKDKINFLKPSLQLAISNPNKDSSKEETQLKLLSFFGTEHHMLARSVQFFSEVKELNLNDDENIVETVAGLKPYVDSDGTIDPKEIYISWYAQCCGVYKRLSKNTISTKKLLKISTCYSDILFPHMKGKTIVTESTAKKTIREYAIFDGLRLLDFSDGRNKVIRTQEEIADTETYLKEIIKVCNRLS